MTVRGGLIGEVTAVQIRRSSLFRFANSALIADGQLMAPFSPPAGQHGPAIRGFHSDSEPVGLRAVTVVRLKRTFWHYKSFKMLGLGSGAAKRITEQARFRAELDTRPLNHLCPKLIVHNFGTTHARPGANVTGTSRRLRFRNVSKLG